MEIVEKDFIVSIISPQLSEDFRKPSQRCQEISLLQKIEGIFATVSEGHGNLRDLLEWYYWVKKAGGAERFRDLLSEGGAATWVLRVGTSHNQPQTGPEAASLRISR